MSDNLSVRIDKFLWSVRVFKTRSSASEACRKGRVIINNVQVKPSCAVQKKEIVIVKKLPVVYTYRIIDLTEHRISAKLVENYIEDITPAEEKIKLENRHTDGIVFREKGSGRPTKKERRTIDRLKDDFFQ
ncbi:MAG TPA: S4 domain-containing protein [Bacteroidales bacterium]|nr:S4 domain-containing protein [Bacteroidales bacterium]